MQELNDGEDLASSKETVSEVMQVVFEASKDIMSQDLPKKLPATRGRSSEKPGAKY